MMETRYIPTEDVMRVTGGYWEFCAVPGCEFCICTWASDKFCYPHTIERIGEEAMKLAYEATHDYTWEEFHSLD